MTIFPFIVDAPVGFGQPSGSSCSVLSLPCGSETVGSLLSAEIVKLVRRKPTILVSFPIAPGYADGLTGGGVSLEAVQTSTSFRTGASTYEPSDWLLFIDARYSMVGFDHRELLVDLGQTPRVARHVVVMEMNAGGTRERVEFDGDGRVRRVQRYYDSVTWTVAKGVGCSLIPASALGSTPPHFETLAELRRELGVRATPSRDVPFSGPCLDLTLEADVLRQNERVLLVDGGRVHATAQVSATSKLIGAVAVQEGAIVGDDAMIVGPAVIGRGATIGARTVVAQTVVLPGATVPDGARIRHQVVTSGGAVRDEIEPGSWGLGSNDLLTDSEDSDQRRIYPVVKTVLEAAVAVTALLLLSPVLLLVAILIKLESRGPVFYGDPREAKDGRLFRCYKFRTMFVGADAAQRDLMKANQMDGPQFKMDRDPRVTRLGRFLRIVSLDELPQLFNVALGQMSLVGPRPSPFRENQTCIPWRYARLSVRPGITGLWQVCRHDRANGDFHQWIYYDMQYVRNMSFILDVKILVATVLTLGGKGHVPLAWMIPNASKEHV